MTPEQQRIAIAQFCGWRWITESQMCGYAPWRKQYYGKDIPTDNSLPFDDLPIYYADLIAMHEAEEKLNAGQRAMFGIALEVVCKTNDRFALIHATTAQRAEAFLRTLNLWQNS